MKKQCINPNELFKSTESGFSQIVVSDPGKLVFISGQVAWDENRNIVGKDDLKVQTQKALENLKTAITLAGGKPDDIVMLRIYIVNYQEADGTIIGHALTTCFGTANPPASTWIHVNGLANPAFLIEIEAQAIL